MGVILSTLGGGSRIKWVNMYRTFLARPGTYKQRPQGRKEPRASSGKSKCIRKSETRDVQEEVKNGSADADKGELAKGPFKLYEGMWTLSRRTWKATETFRADLHLRKILQYFMWEPASRERRWKQTRKVLRGRINETCNLVTHEDERVTDEPSLLPRCVWAVEEKAGGRAGPSLRSIPLPRMVFRVTYHGLKQPDSLLNVWL